jgi:DNA-binding NarL/FixJ family response regulator
MVRARGEADVSEPIRVLVLDPSPRVRQGLRMCLGLEPDLEVVADAADVTSALALASQACPDVVLMDVESAGTADVTAVGLLSGCSAAPRVVLLTLHDDRSTRARATSAGAAALVGKHERLEVLLDAIRVSARHRMPNPGPSA